MLTKRKEVGKGNEGEEKKKKISDIHCTNGVKNSSSKNSGTEKDIRKNLNFNNNIVIFFFKSEGSL